MGARIDDIVCKNWMTGTETRRGQYEKQGRILLNTPLPGTPVFERALKFVKRVCLRLLPERYFFNRVRGNYDCDC